MIPNLGWSRREELNAPSAEDYSAALTLSYAGQESDEESTISLGNSEPLL